MLEHLSGENIKKYRTRTMNAAALLQADEHLAECESCWEKVKNLQIAEGAAADIDFLQFSPEETSHLDYQQLENYVDEQQADEVEREITDVHLKICAQCRSELDGLIEMRGLIEADLQNQPLTNKPVEKSLAAQIRSFFANPYFLPLGFAAFALLLFSLTAFWLTKRESSPETAGTVSPSGSNLPNALPENAPVNTSRAPENTDVNAPPSNNANLQNQSPAENKTNEFPAAYQTEIARALAANRLDLPAELKEINGQNGKLMGGAADSAAFALEAPLGKIIQTDQPQFKWRALDGADGYVVSIYDENFNRVTTSAQISATRWQIDRPLQRNKIYSWQVTALKNGQEIKSPVRPAPDAKFKVLASAKAGELARLSRQYKNEHLALGILYANAGLLDEAAREFEKELNKNPQSKQAQKFLQNIRRLK